MTPLGGSASLPLPVGSLENASAKPEHRLAEGCALGLALASAGSWFRVLVEHTPRIDTGTWPFVAASALAGLGLLLAGLCALRLAPRAAQLSWRTLWGYALLVQFVAYLAAALTSSDVFTNLALGALARSGLSPYAHAPSELGPSPWVALVPPRWVHDPTPYGPLFHPFALAAVWLGEALGSPLWGAFYAFKALLLSALVAALALAARHLRRRASPAQAAETFTWLALGPLLAWEISGQGHNDGLLFLSLVAFWTAAASGRSALAASALAAGVAVKYALAPLLVLFLLFLARRSLARAATAAFIAACVLLGAFAPERAALTLRAVTPMVGGEAARHAHSLTDLVCLVLDHLELPAASALAYRLLAAGSALLCLSLLARTAWRSRTLEELAHGYLTFLMGLYLTAPWFQPWYVAWALPLLLVEPDPRYRRLLVLFSFVTVVQWIAPLDPVTTVAGDGWAAWQLWRLARERPGAAPLPAI